MCFGCTALMAAVKSTQSLSLKYRMLQEKHDVACFVWAFPEQHFLFQVLQQAREALGFMWGTCVCDFTAALDAHGSYSHVVGVSDTKL